MEEPGQRTPTRTRASIWRRPPSCWPRPAGTPKGGVLTNAAGVQLTAEFLLVPARLRAHRAALHRRRWRGSASRPACAPSTPPSISAAHDTFDFDIIVASFPQSLSPGNEQRDFWGSEAADKEGSRNVIGIKNPAIDKLIDRIILAKDRDGSGGRHAARSTACCCGTTTSCRSGIRPSSAWPCGTCSAGRPSCRRARPSFLRVWWWDDAAAKRLADGARQ